MAEVGPSVLYVAQVSGPRPDPAYNLKAEGYLAALETYAKTRRQEDLAKIPLKPGRTPRLYAVQLMDPETFAALSTLASRVSLTPAHQQRSYRVTERMRVAPAGITRPESIEPASR